MPMETTGIRELAAQLGRFPVELKAELEPAVIAAADLVAEQAKANASFSSKIPGQITSGANFSARGGGAEIRVHAGVYPHVAEARVLEGDGYGGEFRHPVYGNEDVWRPQQSHPFLHPAVEAKRAEVKTLIAAAVHKALN